MAKCQYVLVFSLMCWVNITLAQPPDPTPPAPTTEPETLIEDLISQEEEEADFDLDTQFEHLRFYLKKPLLLNKALRDELEEFGLLSPLQITSLLDYRIKVGELITIYELQAIPHFDLSTIRQILPYVRVKNQVDDVQVSMKELMTKGDQEIFVRSQRFLEKKKGYIAPSESENAPYLGGRNNIYTRYRYRYGNKLSYGVTLEKDAGERFFGEKNPLGFDYYSAHFYLHNYTERLKDVAIGDYRINLGQGLIAWLGFGTGKSSYVTNVKRSGRTLNSYSSVNEFNFFRGGAATIKLTKNIDFTLFASYRQRDANITALDTLNEDTEILEISSIQSTGLHRTLNEVEDKNTIDQFNAGGSLKYRFKRGHLAFNGLYTQLSAPLIRADRPQNQFRFQGNQLLNLSVDYTYLLQNLHFFGETARSDNGGIASINGLLMSVHRFVDVAIVHRHFERDYHTLFGQTFSETSGINNENGIYTGLEIKPSREWKLQLYYDTWQHPWLRFNADAPSKGHEYLIQLNYRPRRYTEGYVRLRRETKQQNAPDNITKTDIFTDVVRTQARLHFSHKLNDDLTLRSRAELSWFNNQVTPVSKGVLAYQDIIYKPKNSSWSYTMRYAIFDTDDFNSRIYTYESDLLNVFSIPAYANAGSRWYVKVRYRPIRALSIEGRIAQTILTDQETIGSGLEAIDGNKRTEVKMQVRLRF